MTLPIDTEDEMREELATLYRLIAHFRMTDLIDTHISARVPHTEHFLINEYGCLFHEIRPDQLVKIDRNGDIVDREREGRKRVNRAGFVIHSAVHMAREDVACVAHTHTADGIAVACQEAGLLPISQHALRFHGRLSYHDYEGIAVDLDERERLIRDLGRNEAMILRNHGLLAIGRSVAAAFANIYFLERACQVQTKAQAGTGPLRMPSAEVMARTAAQFDPDQSDWHSQLFWASARRLVV
ncbi:aldolase II superfamily protein [Variovorax sp. SRS16]|uniref:class II aldolase/adducin family protein n=1 Tax=Variovorax sp. SRS16 TaxID=282217 RepID=UPI001316DC23|nr:class II aldolase/adducin family protein [Variovorax sp. SRS16]VTU14892.1 aldolase II superfamily protein [Variovorax sp. SRS16]